MKLHRTLGLATALFFTGVQSALAIEPDGPHIAHADRNAAQWAAEDEAIDSKLAELEAKFGKKPNIIYILADDLGYGDLSCYGQEKFQPPHARHLQIQQDQIGKRNFLLPVLAPEDIQGLDPVMGPPHRIGDLKILEGTFQDFEIQIVVFDDQKCNLAVFGHPITLPFAM